jgi:hypothetical protein
MIVVAQIGGGGKHNIREDGESVNDDGFPIRVMDI